jgi:hypothetical protein
MLKLMLIDVVLAFPLLLPYTTSIPTLAIIYCKDRINCCRVGQIAPQVALSVLGNKIICAPPVGPSIDIAVNGT